MDTKKLRQKILDLAIHGKLVPQDPNDEPANVLLERIRAEKEALIKEGKIKRMKKTTASDTSHYENVPFEVPEGWCWCRLYSVGDIVTGSTPPKDNVDYYGGNIPFYKPTDLEQGINTVEASDSLTELGFSVSRQMPENSVLVTCIGATIGKTGLIQKRGTCNQQINAIIANDTVVPEYLYYTCISGYMQSEIIGRASATTLPILNKNKFSEIPIPVPPIKEQKRIISKIESLFSIVTELGNGEKELIGSITMAKAKVLDLAIHGKLVPQDPNDEPASELLKRINPRATISCDNPHYENVPTGWTKTRLGNLINIVSGVSYNKSDITSNSHGIRILRGGNVQNGKIILEENDVHVLSAYHDDEKIVKKGDIVIVASTGSQLLIGKTGYANHDFSMTQIGAFLRIIRTKTNCLSSYINLVLCSDSFKEHIQSLAKGTNINNLKANHVTDFEILMPPYREQQRIVAKVEELHRTLERIAECLS